MLQSWFSIDVQCVCVCLRKMVLFSVEFVVCLLVSICVQNCYCQCTCVNSPHAHRWKFSNDTENEFPLHLLVNCLKCKVKSGLNIFTTVEYTTIWFNFQSFFVGNFWTNKKQWRSQTRMQTCTLSCCAFTTSAFGFWFFSWKKETEKIIKSRKLWCVKIKMRCGITKQWQTKFKFSTFRRWCWGFDLSNRVLLVSLSPSFDKPIVYRWKLAVYIKCPRQTKIPLIHDRTRFLRFACLIIANWVTYWEKTTNSALARK